MDQQKNHTMIKAFHLFLAIALPVAAMVLLMAVLAGPRVPVVHAASTINVTTTNDEYDAVPNGTCSLREAITTVNRGADFGGCTGYGTPPHTISIPAGTYTLTRTGRLEENTATGDLDITASMIIQGAGSGATIIQAGTNDTNGIDRVFHIPSPDGDGVTVTFNDMTIRYGYLPGDEDGQVDDGAAIHNETGATVNINDCIVTHNTVAGGANDAAIVNQGLDGGGTININNCTISYNISDDDGGGVFNKQQGGGTSTINIANSTIVSNTTENKGGGVYNENGTVTVISSTISYNETDDDEGGGIANNDAGTLSVIDSTFEYNYAEEDGGGLWNDYGTVSISGCTFFENTSNGSNGGGGIYSGYYDDHSGVMTISASTIISNYATYDDAGGVGNDGTLTIISSTISYNWAYDEGGGLTNDGGTLVVIGSTISLNEADGGDGGGGGGFRGDYGGETTFTKCVISDNWSSEEGGGICIDNYEDDNLTLISNCTISGNSAGEEGGGIYVEDEGEEEDDRVTLTISRTTIFSNTAGGGYDGGGIYIYSEDGVVEVALTNCTISGNSVDEYGGGIYIRKDSGTATATLTNCTLHGNSADDGGGFYNDAGTLEVYNTIVANGTGGDCSAGGDGIDTGSNNLIDDTTCGVSAGRIGAVTNLDPVLRDNGGDTETHALLLGSNAIDAVPLGSCTVTTDQRGVPRPLPIGGTCDIGAYEWDHGIIVIEKQTDPDGATGSFSFSGRATGTIADGQQIVVDDVPPGAHAIVEDDPTPSFALTGITCNDGGSTTPSTWDVGTRTATINLDGREIVTCTFTNTKQYILTVNKVGGEATVSAQAEDWSGTVTSEPAGIDCGADCTKYYLKDTPVTLTAHPGVKSYFVGWGGDCDADGQVTMDANKTCIATFGYPVGGIVVPVSKLGLVAPWVGMAAVAGVAALTVAGVRRRRC